MCALNFVILLKCPHFLGRLTTRDVSRTSVYSDNYLVLFHLRLKKTRLTDKKILKVYCVGCSSSEVGSTLT